MAVASFAWSFKELAVASWAESFEELRLFAEANGGVANVPRHDPERPALGTWCRNQARRLPPRTTVD